jgi:hypothetical protein
MSSLLRNILQRRSSTQLLNRVSRYPLKQLYNPSMSFSRQLYKHHVQVSRTKIRNKLNLLKKLNTLPPAISYPSSPVIIVDFLNYVKGITKIVREGYDVNNDNLHLSKDEFKETIKRWIPELVLLLRIHLNAQYIIFVTQFIHIDNSSTTIDADAYRKLNHLFFKCLRELNKEDPIKENYVHLEKIVFGITIKTKKSPRNIDDLAVRRLANLFNDSIVISNDQYSKPQDFNMCEIRILLFKDYPQQTQIFSLDSSSHVYGVQLTSNLDITFINENQTSVMTTPKFKLGFKLKMEKKCVKCGRKILDSRIQCGKTCKSKKTYSIPAVDGLELIDKN